jgi:hypothetical protein
MATVTLNKVTDEIAAIQRAEKQLSAAQKANNPEAVVKFKAKVARLKKGVAEGNTVKDVTAKQLANALLASRKKFLEMSKKDFNGVIKQLAKKPEYAFLRFMTRDEVVRDINRKAKPVGWRFKGRGDYRTPSAAQARKGRANGTVYYENRRNRSDVSQSKQLAKGGSTYQGGGEIIKNTIVYDNEGKTLDRYTVFTPDGSVYAMSENAKGFNQYVGEAVEDNIEQGSHLGKKLKSVPKEIEWAIIDRMNYAKGGSTYQGGGEIPEDWKHKEDFKHNGNTYKIYLNTWNNTYTVIFKGRVAPSFETLNEAKDYIKKDRMNYAKGGNIDAKYENFKQLLITRIQDDIAKAKQRQDAMKQENRQGGVDFENGAINAMTTILFDINELDHEYYNKRENGGGIKPMSMQELIAARDSEFEFDNSNGGSDDDGVVRYYFEEEPQYAEQGGGIGRKAVHGAKRAGDNVADWAFNFDPKRRYDGGGEVDINDLNIPVHYTMFEDEMYEYGKGGSMKGYADSEFGRLEREWAATGIKPNGYDKAKAEFATKGGGMTNFMKVSDVRTQLKKQGYSEAKINKAFQGVNVGMDKEFKETVIDRNGLKDNLPTQDWRELSSSVVATIKYGKGGGVKLANGEPAYMVKRVFQDGSKARVVDENLTLEEAREMVAEDIKSNPKADYYMLTFTKM